jgi:RHS repeat-associated protein
MFASTGTYQNGLSLKKGFYVTGKRASKKILDSYTFGFNGQEKDNEIKGTGNSLDFGERIYDSRLSRFLSVDGLSKKYPWYTPYQFAGNKPINAIDIDGLEEFYTINGSLIGAGNPEDRRKLLCLDKSTIKDVTESRNNGTLASMNLNRDDIVTYPNKAMIGRIDEIYNDDNNIKGESAFAFASQKDGTITLSKTYSNPSSETDGVGKGTSELLSAGLQPTAGSHSHPFEVTGTCDEGLFFSKSQPSDKSTNNNIPADRENQVSRMDSNTFTESSFIIGLTDPECGPKLNPFGGQTMGGRDNVVQKREKQLTYYGYNKKVYNVNFNDLKKGSEKVYKEK